MSIVRLDGVVREVGGFVILDHVGAAVAAGDVLGIVVSGSGAAAPVKAPCAGRIAKCFADAGQGVEYGRPLFLLEPRA